MIKAGTKIRIRPMFGDPIIGELKKSIPAETLLLSIQSKYGTESNFEIL